MLKVDPAHRLTASEVLNHHWITGVTNGNTAGNVLELMKQWKDELNVDDDGGIVETSETVSEPTTTEEKSPKSEKSPSAKQTTDKNQNITKSTKGTKPRSAGSKPAVGNHHTQKHSFNNSTYKQIASSHNNIRTAAQLANSSTLSVTPIRRRSPQLPHDTPVPAIPTDSLTIPNTATSDSLTHNDRETHSAGKRTSGSSQSPSSSVKQSSSFTRRKPEKSPPSQTIKALNKK